MSKLEYALDAASRGFRVFPQQGKRPSIKAWPSNASSKDSVIQRWWARWPDADIGLALDPDVYVLDADTEAALDALAALKLPRTLQVTTARGLHIYFRVPHELARQSPRPGATGLRAVEGKGAPGPVTWAGSRHPSGHQYIVRLDAPIANMPGALVRAIGPRREQTRAGEATAGERSDWAAALNGACAYDRTDGRADLRLVLRALRSDLPHMDVGWADRFYRDAAYLGPHIAGGGLDLDETIGALTAVFNELDQEQGSPEHVLRSIARGVAAGARSDL